MLPIANGSLSAIHPFLQRVECDGLVNTSESRSTYVKAMVVQTITHEN